ncbi:hypothetical protein [Longimicrobium sp.]|uniref:hypothetical protein n=1 Tax=Longimicrobium sp. TaxID=2029185 RepID=UPI003B3B673D
MIVSRTATTLPVNTASADSNELGTSPGGAHEQKPVSHGGAIHIQPSRAKTLSIIGFPEKGAATAEETKRAPECEPRRPASVP